MVSFYSGAGLPIRFSNVKSSSPSKYNIADPRPHMEEKNIPKGLITRGFNASNNI